MQGSTRTRLSAIVAGVAAVMALGVGGAAFAAGGANSGCGPYCANGVGNPSGNGYGNAYQNSNGLPGAGTEGSADNKFPPGQSPNGTDNNNGYECDGNGGVGQTNPAHTGCGPSPSSAPTP